jgi:hypothetical protein
MQTAYNQPMSNNIGIKLRDHYDVPQKQEDILKQIHKTNKDPNNRYIMQIAGEKIFIRIPREEQRWWSPEIYIVVDEKGDGSHIREVLGPNPQVFMLSMFLIVFGSVLGLFALIFALSQASLGISPAIALGIAGGSLLIIIAMLIVMAVGRKKAQPQMQELRDFFKQMIEF